MFKVVRAKTYMFHSTMKYSKKTKKMESHNEIVKKVAGLGEEGKKQLTFDNFARGLTIESGKKASKSVDGGKLILEVKYTIGEL